MTEAGTVLVVDDDRQVASDHARLLQEIGYVPKTQSVAADVEPLLQQNPDIRLILLDIQMPGLNGLELLERIKACRPDVGVVMATVVNDIEEAVRAIKAGAYNYLLKPLQREQLSRVLRSYFSNQPGSISDDARFRPFVTGHSEFREIFRRIRSFAEADVPVLLQGETGTGKEVAAHLLHAVSTRRDRRFHTANMAALPASLFESELFGHARGSFTGALQDRIGHFESAGDGTLFLDEIGELGPEQQTKLLRVLQNRTYCRVGESQERPVSSRIIMATNRPLRDDVQAGRFREDLYYRISNYSITLPPLRERGNDIELLARYFVEKYASQFGRAVKGLSPAALDKLRRHRFPGNVRELEGMISAAVLLEESDLVEPGNLPDLPATPATEAPELERSRCETVLRVMAECSGNQTEAAKKLGIARQTLNKLLREYRERGWMS